MLALKLLNNFFATDPVFVDDFPLHEFIFNAYGYRAVGNTSNEDNRLTEKIEIDSNIASPVKQEDLDALMNRVAKTLDRLRYLKVVNRPNFYTLTENNTRYLVVTFSLGKVGKEEAAENFGINQNDIRVEFTESISDVKQIGRYSPVRGCAYIHNKNVVFYNVAACNIGSITMLGES